MKYYSVIRKKDCDNLCDNMDVPGEQYAKWNKPVRESRVPYDSIYMWNQVKK